MEKYIKTLNRRIGLLTLLAFVAAGVIIYEQIFAPPEVSDSILFGFQVGVMVALGFIAVFYIFKYRTMLGNEDKLKLGYNKENDERLKAIRSKAGVPIILITSVLMIVAGTIIGFYNITVFYTSIAAAYFQLLISLCVKQFYMKKM